MSRRKASLWLLWLILVAGIFCPPLYLVWQSRLDESVDQRSPQDLPGLAEDRRVDDGGEKALSRAGS